MRDVQNIFSFFLVFTLFRHGYSIHVNTLSSTDSLTISSNRTIVSPDDVFELGFFEPSSNTSRWYIGIWYKKISDRTYVWVANRDQPLTGSIGTFKISDSKLILLDDSNNTVWSTNPTTRDVRSPVVAELLDNGNFVMRDSNNNNDDPSGFLWQSFDYPTDTLLPEMKLGFELKTGFDKFLRSWTSPDDPSRGDYTYKLDIQEVPEFFLRSDGATRVYRTGPWNGIRFSSVPDMRHVDGMVDNFTENKEEITYTFLNTNDDTYSRLTLSPSGYLQQSTFIPAIGNWSMLWSLPRDPCDIYMTCGPYSYCDMTTSLKCNCIQGFMPKDQQEWEAEDGSQGCVRMTELGLVSGFVYLRLENIKLPDTTTASVDQSIGLDECLEKCNYDYNCTAYAQADVRKGGSGCVIWTEELMDMRILEDGGQDLYVRLAAAADLGLLKKNKLWLIITGLELVMCLFKTHTNLWFF